MESDHRLAGKRKGSVESATGMVELLKAIEAKTEVGTWLDRSSSVRRVDMGGRPHWR